MDIITRVLLVLIAAFSLALAYKEGLFKTAKGFALCLVFTVIAFGVRWMCMNHETLDYQNFLTIWASYFKQNGGFSALSDSVGNYNVPYLYFLAAFSYIGVRDLYLIKLVSILFDVLLAWGAMRLVGVVCSGRFKRAFTYYAVLLLPTVVLNGAYWGQCDSIYIAFAVISLWCALSDRPKTAVCMIALSFSFKLQAVFLMPMFLVFIFTGRIKWRHLLVFPITYLIIVMPAVIAGRPFMDTLMLYVNQGSTVGSLLNYNSPSFFAMLKNADVDLWSKLGVVIAFAFTLGVIAFLYSRRHSLTDRALIAAAVIFAIGIPFLLPHMHDRYFFGADVLTLVFAVISPAYFLVPICTQFASLLGYHAYLRGKYLFPMSYGSVALIISLVLLGFFLAANTYKNKKRKYS